MNSIIKSKKTYFILGVVFIFVIWFVGQNSFSNEMIIPSIETTFSSLLLLLQKEKTYTILGNTIFRLFISISISFVLGILLAALSKMYYRFKEFVKPLMIILKTLPVAVLIILLLLMFNHDALFVIVSLVVMPLIYEATLNGLDAVDKDITDEIKMLSSIDFTIIRKIYLPIATPFIITSLLQSIGLGLKVLVMAELLTDAPNSIGYEIMLNKNYINDMSVVYAWSILIVVFVLIVDVLVRILSKKLES